MLNSNEKYDGECQYFSKTMDCDTDISEILFNIKKTMKMNMFIPNQIQIQLLFNELMTVNKITL